MPSAIYTWDEQVKAIQQNLQLECRFVSGSSKIEIFFVSAKQKREFEHEIGMMVISKKGKGNSGKLQQSV